MDPASHCVIAKPLRVLLVEDNPADEELIVAQLHAAGFAPHWERVDNEAAFRAKISDPLDVILADYSLPQFNALQVLRIMRQLGRVVPVIVVSGSIGDERAADCIKEGAIDYVLKDRLARLGQAVELAMENRRLRLARASAETELHRALAGQRHLLAHSPVILYALPLPGRGTAPHLLSESITRVLGFTVEEALSPAWWTEHVHPDDRERAEAAFRETQRLGHSRVEYRMRDKSGAYHWMEDNRRVICDASGQPFEIVGVSLDITERKRTEEERREAELQLVQIFRAFPAPIIYATAREHRIIDANDRCAQLFGLPREALINRRVLELGVWAAPAEIEAMNRQLAEKKSVRDAEIRIKAKTGETRTALVSIELIALAREPVFVAMLTDITDKLRLEAEMLRVKRLESVGRLASGIAHDLNNILAPVMMAAPLLRMNLTPEEREKTLATVESSAKRGADLVRQLLIFGRGVEGERGPVDPHDVIREITKIAQETFPKNIVVAVTIHDPLWPVRGDATQLHQVMLNLCVNARDAMPQGGRLTMTVKNVEFTDLTAAQHPGAKPGPYVEFCVSDSGMGIPPEIQDKIFEPFFTTKDLGHGTGLGLSTVQGIVRSHGGFLQLESAVRQGTTIRFYIPALPGGAVVRDRMDGEAAPRGRMELVLVVDDESNIRSLLTDTLQRHGYRVVSAEDGAQAIAVLAQHVAEVGLMITDVDMPIMDGVALTKIARRMKPALKIIATSGTTEAGTRGSRLADLSAVGINAVLPKPYSPRGLLSTIHRVLTGE